jgi:hypothetical protein
MRTSQITRTWIAFGFGLLVTAVVALGQIKARGPSVSVDAQTLTIANAQDIPSCSLNMLPTELRDHLKSEFASWEIQDVSNLSATAKARWNGEKPLRCPGIAVGQFERPNQLSYAVLLVPAKNPDSADKMVIFTPSEGKSTLRKVHEWDKGGVKNYLIHSVLISRMFSPEWMTKLQITTKDAVLFFDSGEDEIGTGIYFWSRGDFREDSVDY